MGIFDSFKKSKFIKQAIGKYEADGTIPVNDILVFIRTTEPLASVAKQFSLTRNDLENIAWGMMANGAASNAKGHFTTISGLLFPDTLAYLLRGERGQLDVSKTETYHQVMTHFETGSLVFMPETVARGLDARKNPARG